MFDFSFQFKILFFFLMTSELIRCYMDANKMDQAEEISIQLLQLCQVKQLALLSNVLQFLVRFLH